VTAFKLAESAVSTAVILFESACVIRHDSNTKEKKTISIEEKPNIL
jgi:hypothetical protein